MTEKLALLLQLASPALPVGAYSYSQGLEAAMEDGVVRDCASAERWIGGVLDHSLAPMEAPLRKLPPETFPGVAVSVPIIHLF